jgi:hypothetical protein
MQLIAPKGAVAASVGGVEYRVQRGTVEVPDAFAPRLFDHGFTLSEAALKNTQSLKE